MKNLLVFRAAAFFLLCIPGKFALKPRLLNHCMNRGLLARSGAIRLRECVALKSTTTGKSEEKDSGHQVGGTPELSDADQTLLTKYREHQQNAARLSISEEVKTLVEQSIGYGVLSTNR